MALETTNPAASIQIYQSPNTTGYTFLPEITEYRIENAANISLDIKSTTNSLALAWTRIKNKAERNRLQEQWYKELLDPIQEAAKTEPLLKKLLERLEKKEFSIESILADRKLCTVLQQIPAVCNPRAARKELEAFYLRLTTLELPYENQLTDFIFRLYAKRLNDFIESVPKVKTKLEPLIKALIPAGQALEEKEEQKKTELASLTSRYISILSDEEFSGDFRFLHQQLSPVRFSKQQQELFEKIQTIVLQERLQMDIKKRQFDTINPQIEVALNGLNQQISSNQELNLRINRIRINRYLAKMIELMHDKNAQKHKVNTALTALSELRLDPPKKNRLLLKSTFFRYLPLIIMQFGMISSIILAFLAGFFTSTVLAALAFTVLFVGLVVGIFSKNYCLRLSDNYKVRSEAMFDTELTKPMQELESLVFRQLTSNSRQTPAPSQQFKTDPSGDNLISSWSRRPVDSPIPKVRPVSIFRPGAAPGSKSVSGEVTQFKV